MLEKLLNLEKRYNELSHLLSLPETISNKSYYPKLAKEYSDIEKIMRKFEVYKKIAKEIEQTNKILDSSDDNELKQLAKNELETLNSKKEKIENQIKSLLSSKEENNDKNILSKNILIEIRAGTGGGEASLFAADLFRMYTKYIEKIGWKFEIMSMNTTALGGFKEVIFGVSGKGAYSRLKNEGGVHRVQRIPVTETSGRVHTSTATVAVLVEPEEIDIQINPDDLRIDTFCSSGPGGQSVNTAYSAVRIVHIPTGIVVQCQDERSQIKNKAKAMRVLRAKLSTIKIAEQEKSVSKNRKLQVGSAERSEKIRTYNFPQNRVTDHRINLTLYKLQNVLDGDLDEMIDTLNKVKS